MKRILTLILTVLALVGFQAVGKEPVRVACVGNSITEGLKLADPASEAYPAQLAAILGEGYEVGNFGKSSTTLLRKGHFPYWNQPQFRAALDFRPDVVIIHLGVNDTDPRNWPNHGDEFVRDYVDLIGAFREVNPKVRVLAALLSPLTPDHRRFKSGTRDWRLLANEAIATAAAATGAELIDFGAPLRDRRNLIPDAVHPNREGARLLAETAAKAVTGNYGGLRLPEIYQSGMVLQRNKPLTLRGTANAGDRVTVSLGRRKASALANNRGEWEVTLPPMEASVGNTMTVSAGGRTLTFTDVAIGEVWLASGQSNMEFELARSLTFAEDTLNSADGLLRLFNMRPRVHTDRDLWSEAERDSTDLLVHFRPARWEQASPENGSRFSAIGWHFGRMLRDSLQVPVGIICNAIGGSGTESWIDVETLDAGLPEILTDWRTNDYVQPWVQKRAGENVGDSPSRRHPYEPSYLFAAGIRPLGAFPIAGVIWYQGESNAHNVEVHERLFPLLVGSWRANWQTPDLPFLTVQLSSLERPSWPAFRDSQRRLALAIPGVEMAVSSDRGEHGDVHPRDKRPIGRRLGLLALSKVYGRDSLIAEGPVPLRAERIARGKVRLHMANGQGMTPEPASFELAEHDGLYFPAHARSAPDGTILLNCPQVPNPRHVRYGWQPYSDGTLTNAANLPASTFHLPVNYSPLLPPPKKNKPQNKGLSQLTQPFDVLPWKDSELYTAINEFEYDYQ